MMPVSRFSNDYQGAGGMLAAGIRAPDFTVPDQNDEPVSLTDLLENGPLILYFYPADFTPGCTREACTLRDLYAPLVAAGVRVAGVSPQSASSHAAFAAKYALPFTLLCDPDKALARAYGVVGPLGFGIRRASFLINRAGLIEDAVLADLRIGRHEEFFRKVVAAQAR
jgi:thioredoxin-dependent peroxiredoxin